jgi:hypothetical protein
VIDKIGQLVEDASSVSPLAAMITSALSPIFEDFILALGKSVAV